MDLRLAAAPRRLFEHERHRVDSEPRDAELLPVAHDAAHLLAHARLVHVEVGLEVVETVEVVLPPLAVERPRGLLDAGKDDAALRVARPCLRPDVPVGTLAEPRMPDRRV